MRDNESYNQICINYMHRYTENIQVNCSKKIMSNSDFWRKKTLIGWVSINWQNLSGIYEHEKQWATICTNHFNTIHSHIFFAYTYLRIDYFID